VNAFGAYQEYYEATLLSSYSSSAISWIGTIQAFCLLGTGIITGPIFDRGYFRALIIFGSFLVVFGVMMTSLGSEYYQIILAQGFCIGLGGGFMVVPSIAIVATYFTTKRALAIGLLASGGSLGSALYPIIFRRLQPKIGFPWVTRVMGFIVLGTLSISIALMKTRVKPPEKARSMVDFAAFKNRSYTIFCLGLFLTFVGLYIPIFDIVSYAQLNVGVGIDMSFYLLSILNAGSAFGRAIPGLLADKYGSLEILIGCTLSSALLAYAWLAVHNLAGLIVIAIFYGFTSGAVVSIQASVVSSLIPEVRLIGTWMGMAFFLAGVGILIGSPISGAISSGPTAGFSGAFIFSASFSLAGGIMFVVIWILRSRK
jgi:MFS family permease